MSTARLLKKRQQKLKSLCLVLWWICMTERYCFGILFVNKKWKWRVFVNHGCLFLFFVLFVVCVCVWTSVHACVCLFFLPPSFFDVLSPPVLLIVHFNSDLGNAVPRHCWTSRLSSEFPGALLSDFVALGCLWSALFVRLCMPPACIHILLPERLVVFKIEKKNKKIKSALHLLSAGAV